MGDYYDACGYLVSVIYSREAQRGGGDVDDRAGWTEYIVRRTVVEVVEIPCGRDCEIARYDCGTLRLFEESRFVYYGYYLPRWASAPAFHGNFRDTEDLRSGSELARTSLYEP